MELKTTSESFQVVKDVTESRLVAQDSGDHFRVDCDRVLPRSVLLWPSKPEID